MQVKYLIIPCFLFTLTGVAATNPHLLNDLIFINCGSTAASAALSGREWVGDSYQKFSSSVEIKGSSTRSIVYRELTINLDPVPYKTARISRSQFSYTFHLNPGQKFIRLHFNAASYGGFRRFDDLFTVEAGPFILLANFSASITARALSVDTITKEFVVSVQENQPLTLVFTPATSESQGTYAFVNGIEIISVPYSLSYGRGGDVGVQVVGHNFFMYVDNMTALELVHRQNIVRDSVFSGDIRGMFLIWATILKVRARNNVVNWKISVDVGFKYLVRVHFCEVGLRMAENGHKDFTLLINQSIASTSSDILHERLDNNNLRYKNYMVMVKGQKQEDKRDLFISLHSEEEFMDGFGPLEGFEVFKLSNDENSLASRNPLPPSRDSSSQTIISVPSRRNVITNVVFATICVVNIIVHTLQKNWRANSTEEENKPSVSAKRLYRRFSLAQIQSATDDFFDAFVIGRGGFGKVYRGVIDNGQQTVAIKRLKSNSKQGKNEFWTEVEMLSELRHVNLVPLIGYCNEQREMIVLYEYMPQGTLADHLYKLARKKKAYHSLSWKQRLKICIGAARGLDYLHTGHDQDIIHRDIKATNILLDEKFVAKISDFGLAKSESKNELQSQPSTNLKGTFGYIDPDYFRTHKFTSKSDIYSFGVVLLEVLCGRPAVEPSVDEDRRSLTMWAFDNISHGQVGQIIDPSLREVISSDSLKTFVMVTERCLCDEPKKRPAIAHVVIELELALEQQENAESLPPKERTSIADALPAPILRRTSNLALRGSTFPAVNSRISALSGSNEASLNLATEIRNFTFSELKAATRNFRGDALLGEGGFGKVYKGWLNGKPGRGTAIAVKKLSPESMQGFKEWQSEVNFLGRLCHPNLVKLLGYCWKDKEMLLVYDFMQKGSLHNHLFGRGSSVQPLPWDIRLKILIGAARGMAFLHALDRKVIHRDFKASHILLDGSYHAKISDFGLAKMVPESGDSHVTTQVMGTYGYAAPEYVATGHLHVKSDVYGFGVVLVEMLTGLQALDIKRPSGKQNLVDWVKPHLSNQRRLKHVVDTRLEGIYPSRSALLLARLSLNCLEPDPRKRPSMQEVAEALERMDAANKKP